MVWNRIASRAVVPGPELEDCHAPIRGTALHACSSPVQFGLGFHGLSGQTLRNGFPLYYVSRKAADARGPSVLPGWYVAAEPGKQFSIHITLVHSDVHTIEGRELDAEEGLGTELFVDGAKPGANTYVFGESANAGQEIVIDGFRQHVQFETRRQDATVTIRPFNFEKASVVEGQAEESGDPIGVIELKVFTGKLQAFALRSTSWTGEKLAAKEEQTVGEKEGLKFGRNIQVGGGSAIVSTKTWRSSVLVRRTPESYERTVNVYIREKFWLEMRHICDATGTPWTPKIFPTIIIDSDTEEDVKPKDKSLKDKRKGITNEAVDLDVETSACGVPKSRKKRKENKDFVDLTIQGESVDLTNCDFVDLTSQQESIDLTRPEKSIYLTRQEEPIDLTSCDVLANGTTSRSIDLTE